MKRRVVVTGLGIISPLGTNVNTAWHQLNASKTGITFQDNLLAARVPPSFGQEIFTKSVHFMLIVLGIEVV